MLRIFGCFFIIHFNAFTQIKVGTSTNFAACVPRSQRTDVRRQMSEDRCQKTENRILNPKALFIYPIPYTLNH
ncbi:hypothetical protein D1AOALGA4SA_651 [Olavius algarvensis Delta 1 endosymbiont]|nr:hypothetical protein D1AOALGA4SA_651 [Olavius algarvensis Delta 1 endosymbiont]